MTKLLLFLVLGTLYGESLEIKQVSFRDKVYLRHFSREMLYHNQAGYVLFGNQKPVCLATIPTKKSKQFSGTLLMKGWKTWTKYNFPHENYIFSTEERIFGKAKYIHLYLINKSSLSLCLARFEDVFTYVLGDTFSEEGFIGALEGGIPLRNLINKNDLLMGLLMGYDYESALAFEQKNSNLISVPKIEDKLGSDRKKQFVKGIGIQPVRWAAKADSQGLEKILKQYAQEERTIKRSLRKRDPLKVFLQTLSAN